MVNAKILETGKRFGNMNTAAAFYPEGLSLEERRKIFLKNRIMAGKHCGFDGYKMFMADQKDKKGSYFEITDEYVRENPTGWSDINEDILLITEDVPSVVIGHPVADCPVVMMEDPILGVSAIAHCSGEMIDKRLPMMVADALVDAYGSKDEDIVAYVSACAGPNWTYDSFPRWAKDEKMWEEGIVADENGIFHIDLRKVIKKQLMMRNIDLDNVSFNMDDTITNPNYYSNSASSLLGGNDPSKAGRHFAGLFYPKTLKKTKSCNMK